MRSPSVRLTPAVRDALSSGRAVVGLESSVLSQGLPAPHNADAARRMTDAVRTAGAEPAVTAVVGGIPTAGVLPDELARLLGGAGVTKASARDLAVVSAAGRDAATTVAGALAICRAAGISVFATGGIGGVHHGPGDDESADLAELARTPIVVVCAGAKAILDLPATVERLETLGVTVVGYGTDEFPGFYLGRTGLPVPHRADEPEAVAAILRVQHAVGHPGAVLVVQPPPAGTELSRTAVEAAVARALESARRAGIRGAAVTPYLLDAVGRLTDGRALATNLALLEANARLAARIAVCLTRRGVS